MSGIGAFISPGRSLERTLERVSLADRLGLRRRLHHAHRRPRLDDDADGLRKRQRADSPGHWCGADLLAHARDDGAERSDHRRVLERPHGARARRLAQGHGRELARTEDRQAGDADARVRRRGASDTARRGAARLRAFSDQVRLHGLRGASRAADLHRRVVAEHVAPRRGDRRRRDAVALLSLLHPRHGRTRGSRRASRRPGARATTSTSSPRCRSRSPTTRRRHGRRFART